MKTRSPDSCRFTRHANRLASVMFQEAPELNLLLIFSHIWLIERGSTHCSAFTSINTIVHWPFDRILLLFFRMTLAMAIVYRINLSTIIVFDVVCYEFMCVCVCVCVCVYILVRCERGSARLNITKFYWPLTIWSDHWNWVRTSNEGHCLRSFDYVRHIPIMIIGVRPVFWWMDGNNLTMIHLYDLCEHEFISLDHWFSLIFLVELPLIKHFHF